MDSSIRSKHTGHVGSSIRDGVGGAIGLLPRLAEVVPDGCDFINVLASVAFFFEGVKGSLETSGNELPSSESSARTSMDLTKTT